MPTIQRFNCRLTIFMFASLFAFGSLFSQLSTKPDPNFYYRLTTQWRGAEYSLDVVNDGKENNKPVLAKTGNFTGQFWRFTALGGGYYGLSCQFQGTKSLDILNDANKNRPILYQTGAFSGQYWKLSDLGGGWVRLSNQFLTDAKALDIINDGVNNNELIMQNAGPNSGQYWKLTKLHRITATAPVLVGKDPIVNTVPDPKPPVPINPVNPKPVINPVIVPATIDHSKIYFIQAKHSGQVLDVAGASNEDLAPVNQYPLHKGANQQWKFIPADNGKYMIQNVGSGKVLDINGAVMENGGKLIQYTNLGGENQKFILVKAGAEFKILAAHSKRALDINSSSMDAGVQVHQWDYAGTPNQIWRLVPMKVAPKKELPVVKGYDANLVVYGGGDNKYIGEFSQTANKTWREISSKDGMFSFTEQQRDEWSVYLYDQSRDVHIRLDLWTKKVMYHTGNNAEIVLYNIIDQYGTKSPSRSGFISFPGTKQTVTVQGLQTELKKEGFTLVQSGELQPNQCALVHTDADVEDISAEFGVLACNVQYGDNVTLSIVGVQGGCDASDVVGGEGAGMNCEAVVIKEELTVKFPGGSTKYNIQGPSANACGSVSTERLCGSVGASLVSTSISVADDHGNGIGLGLDVGVGAGFNGGYENGVLSASLNLKFIVGGSISFSYNPEYVGDKILHAGESGYAVVKGKVVGASTSVKNFYSNELAPGIINTTNKVVTSVEKAGTTTIGYFEETGNTVASEAGNFFGKAAATTGQGLETVGKTVTGVAEKFKFW